MRDLEMSYYNIYHYCNVADNLISYFTCDIEWAPTGAQFTDAFFADQPENFRKYSALHEFCEFVIDRLLYEETHKQLQRIQDEYDKYDKTLDKRLRLQKAFCYDKRFTASTKIEIDYLFDYLGIKHKAFFDFLLERNFTLIEDSYDEFIEFDSVLGDVVLQLSKEMFYVLFQNRDFLLKFNLYLSYSNHYDMERCSIPFWAKRAVKYRDKGRCVFCGADLSGLLDVEDDRSVHYDHIVPLHEGGINDISNLQLLCQHCNTSKKATILTSNKYKDWYNMD